VGHLVTLGVHNKHLNLYALSDTEQKENIDAKYGHGCLSTLALSPLMSWPVGDTPTSLSFDLVFVLIIS